jgi:hypothetical protein
MCPRLVCPGRGGDGAIPRGGTGSGVATGRVRVGFQRSNRRVVGVSRQLQRFGLGSKEFLTYKTTCANELPEIRTPCEFFCQKRPPTGGGTYPQATRVHAAWAGAGRGLPPMPTPACCRSARAVGPAANAHAGMSTWQRAASGIAGTLGSPTGADSEAIC